MTKDTPATVTSMDDANNARWLARALAPARAHIATIPSDDAISRIRARVMGDAAPRKRTKTLAA